MVSAVKDPKYSISTSDHRCALCEAEIAADELYFSAVRWQDEEFCRSDYCNACWLSHLSEDPDGGRPRCAGEEVFAYWRTRRPPPPSHEPRRVRFDAQVVFEFFLGLREPIEPTVEPAGGESAAPETESAEGPERGDSQDAAQHDADRVDGEPPTDAERQSVGETREVSTELPGAGDVSKEKKAGAVADNEREELRFFLSLLLIRKKFLEFKSSTVREGREWLVLVERKQRDRVHTVLNPELDDARLEILKDKIGDLLQMRI